MLAPKIVETREVSLDLTKMLLKFSCNKCQFSHVSEDLPAAADACVPSGRLPGRHSRTAGRLALQQRGQLVFRLLLRQSSTCELEIKIEALGASPSQPSPLTEDLN